MSAIDDFMDEFAREDGFFLGLHQRQFDPVAAQRALQALRRIEVGIDHGENYRLAHHLFQAMFELTTYGYYNRDDELFDHHFNLLFPEIAEQFNAIGRLGYKMRES